MVSIVGLSITFIALGVFIGVIYLLKAIFPYKPEVEEGEVKESEDTPGMSKADDEEIAAAIAAVVYMKEKEAAKPAPNKNPIWTSR
jgi:sodium pump decarboxylase gamma subunit